MFLPERLEALGELARARPDLDILTTDAYMELDGEVVRRCYTDSYRFVVDDQRQGILLENFIIHAAVRRERMLAVGGFDESIRWTADWDCWLRMVLDGSRAGLVAEPLMRYRLHRASLSSQRESLIAGRLLTLGKACAQIGSERGRARQVRSSIAANEVALRVARARAALLECRSDARRRAFDVVVGSGHGARTRARRWSLPLRLALQGGASHRRRARRLGGSSSLRVAMSSRAAVTKSPAVSVVMPVRDGERFLREAVESVLAQTLTDVELVAVDDGSTDSTRDILEEYARADGRVVVRTTAHVGQADARNAAVAVARGDLIAFLDADDVAYADRLERQCEFLARHEECALVGGALTFIDEDGCAFAEDVRYP